MPKIKTLIQIKNFILKNESFLINVNSYKDPECLEKEKIHQRNIKTLRYLKQILNKAIEKNE